MKKVYELCTLCNVDVYLVAVHHGDETFIVNTRGRDWHPSEQQLVSNIQVNRFFY